MEFRFLCQNKALPDLLSFCSASTHPTDALHSCHIQTTTVPHKVLFCVCICVSVLFAWNSPHLLWGLRNCSSFTWGTVVSLPKFSLNVTFSLTQVKSVAPLYACQSPHHPLQCHHLLMSVFLPPRMMSSASLYIRSSSLWLAYSKGLIFLITKTYTWSQMNQSPALWKSVNFESFWNASCVFQILMTMRDS